MKDSGRQNNTKRGKAGEDLKALRGKAGEDLKALRGKAGEGIKALKVKVKELNKALSEAYDAGYAQGWDDHGKVPDKASARVAAAVGYGNGMKAHSKAKKAQARVSKASSVKRTVKV